MSKAREFIKKHDEVFESIKWELQEREGRFFIAGEDVKEVCGEDSVVEHMMAAMGDRPANDWKKQYELLMNMLGVREATVPGTLYKSLDSMWDSGKMEFKNTDDVRELFNAHKIGFFPRWTRELTRIFTNRDKGV